MILSLPSNAQRAVLVAASIAVALVLSYFSIRNALATHYAGLQTPEAYERAVHLEPAKSQNWYLLGRYWQYNLEDPDAAVVPGFATVRTAATAAQRHGALTEIAGGAYHVERIDGP